MTISKRSFLVSAAALLLFTGCSNNGKDYKLDKEHNVLYKGEGLDEFAAKKLGEYLKEEKYFQDGIPATVQIVKSKETKDTVYVNFVYDQTKVNPEIEKAFIALGGRISETVFAKSPVNICLLDSVYKMFRNIGPATAADAQKQKEETTSNTQTTGNDQAVSDNNVDFEKAVMPPYYKQINQSRFYYNKEAASHIPAIQAYLTEGDFFTEGKQAQVVLLGKGDEYVLKLPMADSYLNDKTMMDNVQMMVNDMQDKFFSGETFAIWLCDLQFKPVHSFLKK